MVISCVVLLRMRKFSDGHCRKNQNTFCINNFFPGNRVVYEITWKNTVQPGRPQMTIRHIRFACWITKVTNTHLEYVVLLAVVWQQ